MAKSLRHISVAEAGQVLAAAKRRKAAARAAAEARHNRVVQQRIATDAEKRINAENTKLHVLAGKRLLLVQLEVTTFGDQLKFTFDDGTKFCVTAEAHCDEGFINYEVMK